MSKHISILTVILFLFCSFRQDKQDIKPLQKRECHTIDLDSKREKRINLSSIYKKNVKTIILETSENCLIGEVSEMQVFEGKFYILDNSQAKSLFVFDRDGRFIRKIGNLGRGPGEYSKISDFTIDAANKHIYILDQVRIHRYRMDGTYINTIHIKLPKVNIKFIQYYNGKLYSDVCGYTREDGGYLLQEINPKTGEIEAKYLNLSYNKGWNESFSTGHNFFLNRMGTPRYAQLFTDTIASLSGGITPFLAVKSKDWVTPGDIERLNNYQKEEMYPYARFNTLLKTTKTFDINNYVEIGNNIIFDYQQGKFSKTVWYDTRSQNTRITDYLYNDLVYKDESVYHIRNFSDGKGVYEVIGEACFPYFFEISKKGGLLSDLDKREELMRLTEDSNPVIFYYEVQ